MALLHPLTLEESRNLDTDSLCPRNIPPSTIGRRGRECEYCLACCPITVGVEKAISCLMQQECIFLSHKGGEEEQSDIQDILDRSLSSKEF